MTTKQKKQVTFIAPSGNLRLVLEPRRRVIHEGGVVEVTDGKHVEFHNGRFSTDDADVIKALRDHDLKDAGAGVAGNFVEEGKEPGRPLPETRDLLKAIVHATADKDADRLAEIYVTESSSHSRSEVLDAAAAGLDALDKDVPDPPETPLHEQMRVRPAGVVGAQPGEGKGPAPAEPLSVTADNAQPTAPDGTTDAVPTPEDEGVLTESQSGSKSTRKTADTPSRQKKSK